MTQYPTIGETLAVHATLIMTFGGSQGIRDLGALESALGRPRTGYYTDLIQEAAALWESLSQNHAFIDGNKRVAITVTAAFLKINGYTLKFKDHDAYLFLNSLYETGRMRFDELDCWLRDHVAAVRTPSP